MSGGLDLMKSCTLLVIAYTGLLVWLPHSIEITSIHHSAFHSLLHTHSLLSTVVAADAAAAVL